MSKRLTIHTPEGKAIYDIVIEQDFGRLGEELRSLYPAGRRFCIVADTGSCIYAKEVAALLDGYSAVTEIFTFPAGEENKTLDTVRRLYAFLIDHHFDRKDCLLALGGGVVGDLAGFTAATYLRGIDFVQIPTTLLAQSDSSVGGKTGVDFDGYKNMVGAFSMPRLVYMNTGALKTLDERTYIEGLGEVIKHGFIADPAYLAFLENNREAILSRDPEIMVEVAYGNCRIKGAVVEEDPTEKGRRRILNYGHTLGHAIEKQLAGKLYHGECVAIGMAAAAGLGVSKGVFTQDEANHVLEDIHAFHLPSKAAFDVDSALNATKNDKKMVSGHIAFILLKSIGEAYVDMTVTDEEMRAALYSVCEEIA